MDGPCILYVELSLLPSVKTQSFTPIFTLKYKFNQPQKLKTINQKILKMEENRRSFYDNVPEIDVATCQNINHLGGHLSCLTYDSPKGPCRNFLNKKFFIASQIKELMSLLNSHIL